MSEVCKVIGASGLVRADFLTSLIVSASQLPDYRANAPPKLPNPFLFTSTKWTVCGHHAYQV
jgi:hypothetical protein